MRRKERKPRHRIAWFCLALLVWPPGLPAEEVAGQELLASAARLEAEGKDAEAAALYRRWLEDNPASERLFGVLVQALKLETAAGAALELLETYTPAVRNPQDRHTLLYNRALILEMLGRLEEAQELYAELPAYGQVLYKRALLLFEQGDLEAAETHLLAVVAEVEDKEIRARALNLRARLELAAGRRADAERTFEELLRDFADVSVAPVFMLAYFEYLLAADRRPEAQELLEELKQRFPASPEYRLALSAWRAEDPEGAEIQYAPAPWRLLAPLQSGAGSAAAPPAADAPAAATPAAPEAAAVPGPAAPGPAAPGPTAGVGPAAEPPPEQAGTSAPAGQPPPRVLVQAGSFSVAENAHYLQRDLAAKGFAASIAEVALAGKIYYRVLIGPEGSAEAAQQTLLRLKDAGFEGVLLWSED
jgi:cell division protein FtsN